MDPTHPFSIKFLINDKSVPIRFIEKAAKECPRCQGKSIFVIDIHRKEWWCRDCTMSFVSRSDLKKLSK